MDLATRPNAEKKTLTHQALASSSGVGYACRKGRKPGGRVPNQDSWCVHRVPGRTSAFGIFDGHGEKGHFVSDFVRHALPGRVVRATQCEDGEALGKVQACYEQVQKDLYSKPHLGVQQSGTTATVVVQDHARGRLLVSHVGDSSAVLVRSLVGTAHKVEGARLTRDHKPELSDE